MPGSSKNMHNTVDQALHGSGNPERIGNARFKGFYKDEGGMTGMCAGMRPANFRQPPDLTAKMLADFGRCGEFCSALQPD